MSKPKLGCSLPGCNLGDQCEARPKLVAALGKYFSHSIFRPGQVEAMLPLMHGKDVFARMATGAGKSLCMYLPTLAMGASSCGVITSPLNALMEEQVRVEQYHSPK